MQRYLIIILFFSSKLLAQPTKWLIIKNDAAFPAFIRQLNDDSLELNNACTQYMLKLNEQGYLAAMFTDRVETPDSIIVTIQAGKPYKWINLHKGNVPDDILTAAGFRERDYQGKKFSAVAYKNAAQRMLQYLERNGYPFAELKLDSIKLQDETIEAAWHLTTHDWIQYDSIEIIGTANVKKWYLEKYLGVKLGTAYNEQHIQLAANRLNQLPFITANRPARVYFFANKAKPILYADERKASSADGIVGFAPNAQANNNKLLLTGEANLKLQNLFETGKALEINYRSFLGNSQQMRLYFLYPYLLRTNVGADYNLQLIKQDSSFLDVHNQLGLQYRFIGQDYLRVYYAIQTTSLISVDTLRIRTARQLPPANDLTNYQYGIEVKKVHLDYMLNPMKGYSFLVNTSIGDKRIKRNLTVDAIQFTDENNQTYSLYDRTPLRMLQYKIQAEGEAYIRLGRYVTTRWQLLGASTQAPVLFLNDLYRIGGLRTLKGFDEQAIFAATYMILNTELRYLIQRNAHIALFWNGAYYENTIRNPIISDTPYGFGAGFNFETNAGIFSLYYALGKQFNNPIEFNMAKIHFGFSSLF